MAPRQTRWRVTHENPVLFEERLDFECCAALHNELLNLGWTGSGKSLDELETSTWFDHYGEAAENTRSLLSDDLVAFLERAFVVEHDNWFSLFYYVYGLVQPERLRETFEWREEDDTPRYVTLYGANAIASHPEGLVFDMKTNKAIMQMSIHDADITLNGRV